MYSPLTVLLYDGDLGDVVLEHAWSLGHASVNLFDNAPEMPTLRDMHRIIASHPMIQAKLFLFLEVVLTKELLCVEGRFHRTADLQGRWDDVFILARRRIRFQWRAWAR